MSRFFSDKFSKLTPYTPGEQPQDKQYLKLNTNESPFPPSPIALRLGRQAAGESELYPDPDCKAIRAVGAERFHISEDEIIFTNGSDEVLNFAIMAFCDEAHPLVFPDITYGFFSVFAELNKVPYEEIPLKEDLSIDIKDYIGIHKNILIANPNALTGIALTKEEIETIVASNPDNIVIIDEAYVDFGGESAVELIHKYDNLLVTQTFSKSRSLAGARLGFGIACKAIIQDLNTIRFSTNPYNINRVTMALGVGAFTDEHYFQNNCRMIKETRTYTEGALTEMGFEMTPSSANFIFVKKEGLDGKALYLKLKEKGVLVRHFDTERVKDYLRITIGSREQMETFITLMKTTLEEWT